MVVGWSRVAINMATMTMVRAPKRIVKVFKNGDCVRSQIACSDECHRRESNSQLPDLESGASTSWATVARVVYEWIVPTDGFEPSLNAL